MAAITESLVEQLPHLILVFRLETERQTALQGAVQVAQGRQAQGRQAQLALAVRQVQEYRLALFQVAQKLQQLAEAVEAHAGQGQAERA